LGKSKYNKEYQFKYRLENCEKRKQYNRQHTLNQKILVLKYYSKTAYPSCECCGESHVEFLTIDHINGNGSKHRLKTGPHIYRWLIKNDFPVGYRVLCFNCNCALGHAGYCPHGNITKGIEIDVVPSLFEHRVDEQMPS
jgi:hypothetical protein